MHLSIQRQIVDEEILAGLPKNSYGLPLGIYRIDLLPEDPTEEELENSFTPIEYHEGFPTLADGRPFWSQLPFESPENFRIFEAYLNQPHSDETGIRSMSLLTLNPEARGLPPGMDLQGLQVLFHNYYWGARTKSYDLFQKASFQKQQEHRALNIQDEHYLMAQKLMGKLSEFVEDDDDFWDLMTPKVAIDFLKQLVSMQRISVGLPAGGPSGNATSATTGQGKGSSLEVIIRKLAQDENVGESNSQVLEDGTELMSKALETPETAKMAQELILRMSVGEPNENL